MKYRRTEPNGRTEKVELIELRQFANECCLSSQINTVADPGLQITGQGGGGEGYAVIQTLRNEKSGAQTQ